jgi:hypothetical protein
MKAEKLVEILSAAGHIPRHFVYRATDHEVLAFTTDDVVESVAEIVGGEDDANTRYELVEMFRHTAIEIGANGTIVYFPRIGYS